MRLAAQRRISALGPISLVLKEEPTAAHALQTLCRYLQLVNPSLMLHIERAGELVILREELLPSPGLQMRQSVELAVGTLYRLLSELAGPHWRAREVCFAHRPPQDLRAHRAFFGRSVKFNQALMQARREFLESLAKRRAKSQKYLKGWLNREDRFKAEFIEKKNFNEFPWFLLMIGGALFLSSK